MTAKNQINNWGGGLFLLLCLILLMGYSSGMVTLFALFCIFFTQRIHKIDSTAIILAVFSITYVLISYHNDAIKSLSGMVIFGLPWFFFYCYGKYVARRSLDDNSLIDFILIVALLGGLPVYISIIYKIISTGSIVDTDRLFYTFGNEMKQGSGNDACLDVFMGYAGLAAFFLLTQRKKQCWLFIMLFLLSILVAINTVTRFPIVASVICFIIVMFSKNKKKPLIFIGELLLILGVVFLLYSQSGEIGQVFEAFAARNEDMENVRTLSDRTYRWTEALSLMINHPFGWYNASNAGFYVHNMWLDIAKYSGIVPFILLAIATIRSLMTNIRILKIIKTPLAFIFLSLNLCFILSAFVQPVYGSLCVAKYCLIWGLQSAYLDTINLKRA